MEVVQIDPLVEDKDIKFDRPNLDECLRNGEKVLDIIHHIEDTKGNPGDVGRLMATSLRLIWLSVAHRKYNLAIGYGSFINTNSRVVTTKQHGNAQALYILAASNATRFEFLFTDTSEDAAKRHENVFASIFEIYQLYKRSYLYRDLKLRGHIIQSGQLILLPQEEVFSNVQGVWNLSSDQGNLGCFVITNVRVVWFADANETFNITLPFLQIENIRIRESKYGPALVINVIETAGGYVLGFRIDPVERLDEIYRELCTLHATYTKEPNLGVVYDPTEAWQQRRRQAEEEDQRQRSGNHAIEEIDEQQEREINSKLNAYLADGLMSGAEKPRRDPVYCKELGFAMERIRDGFTLKDLWDVLPSTATMTIDDDDKEDN